MVDQDRKPQLEKEVEAALRMERIERAVEALTENLKKNTDSTAELVEAWKGAKWLVGLVKILATLVVAYAAANAAWHKIWG